MTKTVNRFLIFLAIILILPTACQPLKQSLQATATVSETTTPAKTPEPTPIPPTATATEQSISIWFDPSLPSELMQGEISTLITQYGAEKEAASLQLSFSSETGISEWIFALVAPFATVQDSVTTEEFIGFC